MPLYEPVAEFSLELLVTFSKSFTASSEIRKKPFAPIKVIRAKGEISVKMVITGMVSLVGDIFRTL